jgi:S1-C subfamily serine protease
VSQNFATLIGVDLLPEKIEDQIQEVIQMALPASCSIFVRNRKKNWSGSGFHIGGGLVVTASHVAPPELGLGGDINITFDSKIFFPCSVVKSDPSIDSAILKIEGDYSNIQTVSLADSDAIEVGEMVSVIGSPEGWHDTVTVGRVSNMHQYMPESPSPAWLDVIFVDAKILQGVSGGMCVGTDGLVIGSVIGVTGVLAEYGVGENVLCPANKINNLVKSIQNTQK